MAKAARSRLTEVRVRTATADHAKHGRQLFDGLGSNGLYLHVTPAGAKCRVQQLMVPNPATGKSRRVRIGLGAWPRVTLAEARKAAFANVHARLRRPFPALALEFMILTATRSSEARGASWNEIDLDARTWAIPLGRMKAKRARGVRRMVLRPAAGGRRRLPRSRYSCGPGPGGHDSCAASRLGNDRTFVAALHLATAAAGPGGAGVGSTATNAPCCPTCPRPTGRQSRPR